MYLPKDSKILLVGEGNFSFAVVLCEMKYCSPEHLVATSFEEKDALSLTAKENCKILQDIGAVVLYNIDGRKLESYFEKSFSVILFNFPHCGGKMKIHNNRRLLREFFKSAVIVLEENGFIYVTLCGGQGGIPLDIPKRRWDDSWQIVLMAAYSDLILSSLGQFDAQIFEGYHCSGYRSLNKGFNQNGSLLYKFSKKSLVHSTFCAKPLDSMWVILDDDKAANIPLYLFSKIKRNICDEKESLLQYSVSYIINILKTFFTVHTDRQKIFKNSICNLNQYYIKSKNEITIFPALVLSSDSSSLQPFLIIMSDKKFESILDSLFREECSLCILNKSKSLSSAQKKWFIDSFTIKAAISDSAEQYSKIVYKLNLKDFATYLFDLEYNEIWRDIQKVYLNKEGVVLYESNSLFPPVYKYHLSFWVPNSLLSDLDELHFKIGTIIVNTVQNSLVSFSLLQSFVSKIRRYTETYEIVYCSYDGALSDIEAKRLHTRVGEKINYYLKCDVR